MENRAKVDKSTSLEQRVNNERSAHTEDDVLQRSKDLKSRFSHINSYPSLLECDVIVDNIVGDLSGKVVLDYGCGIGDLSLRYIKKNALVNGIDISLSYIDSARALMSREGVDPSRYDFRVMDAHNLEYPDNSFDVIIGNGILHHLDIEVAISEIFRVLKDGGRVVLKEPLADNPLLRLFRLITPNARTVDEAPLSRIDLKIISNSRSWRSESYFCGIVEAPVAMITSIIFPRSPQNFLLTLAHKVECFVNRFDLFNSMNQYILLNLVKINDGPDNG